MDREIYVVQHIDYGRVPIRAFSSHEAAQAWCIGHCEDYLRRKQHPRSGVLPVKANELPNLGYDIFVVRMEE